MYLEERTSFEDCLKQKAPVFTDSYVGGIRVLTWENDENEEKYQTCYPESIRREAVPAGIGVRYLLVSDSDNMLRKGAAYLAKRKVEAIRNDAVANNRPLKAEIADCDYKPEVVEININYQNQETYEKKCGELFARLEEWNVILFKGFSGGNMDEVFIRPLLGECSPGSIMVGVSNKLYREELIQRLIYEGGYKVIFLPEEEERYYMNLAEHLFLEPAVRTAVALHACEEDAFELEHMMQDSPYLAVMYRKDFNIFATVRQLKAARGKEFRESDIAHLFDMVLYQGYQVTETDMRGICHILPIPEWKEHKELSETWVKKYIYQALFNVIGREQFLPLGEEYLSLKEAKVFLIDEEKEYRSRLRELLRDLPGICVPDGEDDWYGALKNYPVSSDKVWTVERLLCQAEKWLLDIKKRGDEDKAEEWLLSLCQLGLCKPETSVEIKTGQIAVLPSQKDWDINRLHTVTELKRDPDIPEILKDVCEQLDRLRSQTVEKLDIRNRLLRPRFGELPIEGLEDFETAKMESYIIQRSSRNFPVQNFGYYQSDYMDAWKKAWMLLISCGPDEKFYQLCTPFFGASLPAYKPCCGKWGAGMWKPCMKSVLEQMIEKIAACKTLPKLKELYFKESGEETIDFLNRLLPYAKEYVQDISYKTILPDQKGNLTAYQWLYADGTPNEELKEIARVFCDRFEECDFYKKLLDRRIKTELLSCSAQTEENVAMILDRTITKILSEGNLGDAPLAYQMACGRLLSWMEGHEEQAAKFFPSFVGEEGKARLVTPAAIVDMQRKNREVEKILVEAGVSSIEELYEIVKKNDETREGSQTSGKESIYFNSEYDVGFDDGFSGYGREELSEILREIGTSGEVYALERIRQYFLAEGFSQHGTAGVDLRDGFVMERTVDGCPEEMSVAFGDRGGHHQPGWDIKITHRKGTPENREENVYYLEVKTHTPKSAKRNLMILSSEQMRLAAREKGRYIVLKTVYDYSAGSGISCTPYQDPITCYGQRRLELLGEHFTFRAAG